MERADQQHDARGALVAKRFFQLDDQRSFAAFSGDHNPVHLDQKQARRTIAGQIVVHGVHAVLWALEAYLEHGFETPTRISVNFRKPIFLNEEVQCAFARSKNTLSIWRGDARLVDITLRCDRGPMPSAIFTPHGKPAAEPAALSESDFASVRALPLRLRGDWRRAETLFPAACEKLGAARVCDLAATSEIVGMQAPGLNSLYLSLQAEFVAQHDVDPYFRIDSFDPRFRILTVVAETASLSAKISALVRPTPTAIAPLNRLETDIAEGEFKAVNALIVGGSRGLGEATAKIISLGGGAVTLTYSVGAEDARRIAEEINAHGGSARTLHLDVTELAQITSLNSAGANQVYFFATPKIFGKRSAAYDPELFARFRLFYVDAFAALVERCRAPGTRLAAFYPSSIAIEQPLPELAEYIAAKQEGEDLCARLNELPDVDVIFPRLPRIQTDQTAAVVAAAARDAVEIMTPLVRSMAACILPA